jgi:hypothetical protein
MNPIPFKKLALVSATTAILAVASQGAFAHTRLAYATVTEGYKIANYVNIGHGCPSATGAGGRASTIGTNVIWPNAVSYVPVVTKNDGSGLVLDTVDTPLETYTPLTGIGVYMRGTTPWPNYGLHLDALGNTDGFWTGGAAYDQTVAEPVPVPMYSAAVTFKPASCARSITFVAQVADFCSIATPSSSADDEDVLYWSPIPKYAGAPYGSPTAKPAVTGAHSAPAVPAGAKYSNYDGYQDPAHTITGDGWGSPLTLTVVRDLVKNPLPIACAANTFTAGSPGAISKTLNQPFAKYNSGYVNGYDVYVYPSAAQINDEMPIVDKGITIWQ